MDPSSASGTSSLTRRRILAWSGAGAVGAITGYLSWPRYENATGTVVPVADERPMAANPVEPARSEAAAPTGIMDREHFVPHLKSVFVLDSGVKCTLTEIGPARKLVGPTAEFTSFSLLFTAAGDIAGESRIHRLTHREMGELELFLSPVGHSREHAHLEAVFSQRV